jgi:hypothetical protein
VLAGVRSASIGMPVEVTATAPFTTADLLFGHNGFVPDAAMLRSLLPPGAVPESRVDSALLWALVVDRLEAGAELEDALADVVRTVAARTDGRMNLFLTDGSRLAATTWGDTLWFRVCPEGVLVASEPDTAQPAAEVDSTDFDGTDLDGTELGRTDVDRTRSGETSWQELPDRTLLTVEQGRISTSALGGAALEGIA